MSPIFMERPGVRERFRRAGRQVLREPRTIATHVERIRAACGMQSAEPLQGALADLLCACLPDPARFGALLHEAEVRARLSPSLVQAFERQIGSSHRLARITPLATRWSVVAIPSLNVPRRAMLCGVDDSRMLASKATQALLAHEAGAEEEFLDHCEGALDTLAFMLVRRALLRHGQVLSARWDAVAQALQDGMHTS